MNPAYRGDSRPVSSHGSNTQNVSLRPRNRRLISGLDEPAPVSATPTSSGTVTNNNYNHNNNNSLTSPFASPYHSRAPSPIPSKHPSRSSSAIPQQRNNAHGGVPSVQYDQLGSELASSLSGLWGKSWTSLQGLASNVLGSDAAEETVKDKSPQRSRRPFEATHNQWGPSTRDESQPGAGSREERKALVREKKRKDMLMNTASTIPENSKFKRRTSDEYESASAVREDGGLPALVYIHHVKREDTVAGLSIRFNCQLGIIKRANRLWSNDAIQSRKTIVVPVDSCGVRGKRVPSPGPTPVSAVEDGANDMKPPSSLAPLPSHTPKSSITSASVSPQSATTRATAEEPPWQHDSWIHLDGQQHPIEIARMSQQDLGFFPRARRKSKSYSDLDTPSASFDLPRPSITVSDMASGSCGPAHRKRGSSGSSRWTQKMSGPGGVGTLGGKGVSTPGPATDKFTKAISKHLPNVAPPAEATDDFDDDISQTSGGGGGLENFGGAIESWVRKLAQTAAKAVDTPLKPGELERRRNLGLRPRGSGGDLIELSNAFEIGPDDDEEPEGATGLEEQRGRSLQNHRATALPARTLRPDHDEGSKRKGD